MGFDERAFRAVYAGDTPGAFLMAMVLVTTIGGGWGMLGVLPLFAARRTRAFAIGLTAAIAAQAIVVWGIKALIQRVRPWRALHLAPLVEAPTDYSFPSGHATGSFTFASFAIVILLWGSGKMARSPARWAAAVGIAALAATVAVSRVVLGAHWPGDVAAGAILGTAIGTVAARITLRRVGLAARASDGRDGEPHTL